MKVGIVVFPGTNCEEDTFHALKFLGFNCSYIYHNENINNLFEYKMIVLPGGFSFGDYVASGRLAKFSPIISRIKEYIKNKSGLVIGICNGFQILCETSLLPGALTYNKNNRFISKSVNLKLNYENENLCLNLPIAHFEGNFYASSNDIKIIKEKKMDFLTYEEKVNGSILSIAGLYDSENHIMGLMPHPERAVFDYSKSQDGKLFFEFIKKEILLKI